MPKDEKAEGGTTAGAEPKDDPPKALFVDVGALLMNPPAPNALPPNALTATGATTATPMTPPLPNALGADPKPLDPNAEGAAPPENAPNPPPDTTGAEAGIGAEAKPDWPKAEVGCATEPNADDPNADEGAAVDPNAGAPNADEVDG